MDVLKGRELDSIYAEFADVMSMLTNLETVTSLQEEDIQTTGCTLFNQACLLGLIDILESILPHFDTIFTYKEHHGQVLYDCIAVAHEQKHDNVVRMLLQFEYSKQSFATPETKYLPSHLSMLQCAASRADVEIIALLLNSGFDVNQTNDKGETALHYACDAATADVLITNGADVNVMNAKNQTPLYFARMSYRMGVMRKLLDNGAKPDLGSDIFPHHIVCEWNSDQSIASAILQAFDMFGFGIPLSCVGHSFHCYDLTEFRRKPTPYLYCTSCKRENKVLLQESEARKRNGYYSDENIQECGITPGTTPLHAVVSSYYTKHKNHPVTNMEVINEYLSNCDSKNVNALDGTGATALYYAVEKNIFEVATLLLNSGADPNLTTSSKYPLVVACRFTSYRFVELLLNRGANPNVFDKYHYSPLLIAVKSLDERVVRLLVQHGADVNLRNQNGFAPSELDFYSSVRKDIKLCHCSRIIGVRIFEILTENGLNFNKIDEDNRSLHLHEVTYSSLYGDIYCCQLFKFMLERGADLNFVNSDYGTITHIPFLIREMLRRGWDPNKPDGHGRNLLGIAFAHSNLRCARILLAAGADPNLVTWDSLVCATQHNNAHVEAIDFLLASGVKFNVPNESALSGNVNPSESITLRDFCIPFCSDNECIVRLFKAGADSRILAACCNETFYTSYGLEACTSADRLVKAVVLAGHGVQEQEEFAELLKQSDRSHARDLGLWLEEDSMTPPSLLRLSRSVIRRRLSAVSGRRTILPLIDVLPISNAMQLYLKFEGPFCEIDLSYRSSSEMCNFCEEHWFFYLRVFRILDDECSRDNC